MTYQITNVPHVVLVEHSWQEEKVVYSLPPNIDELIRHAVHISLDNSYKICFNLNCVCSRPNDSKIPMHSVNPTSKSCSLVLMVCRSRDAMNYILSVLTNLAAIKSDELFSSIR